MLHLIYMEKKNQENKENKEKLYLENERSIFGFPEDKSNNFLLVIGFILYFIFFVILIPILLIKNKYFEILAAYFPNLDLIATIIGYHGGPMNTFIWKHLYNPADSTISGYISSNIINYFALLGVTYVVAHYTFISKNIYKGWTRAIFMLLITYFIPGNLIILYMNKIGKYLNKFYESKSLLHYLIVVLFGLFITLLFILLEAFLIDKLSPNLVTILKSIY